MHHVRESSVWKLIQIPWSAWTPWTRPVFMRLLVSRQQNYLGRNADQTHPIAKNGNIADKSAPRPKSQWSVVCSLLSRLS